MSNPWAVHQAVSVACAFLIPILAIAVIWLAVVDAWDDSDKHQDVVDAILFILVSGAVLEAVAIGFTAHFMALHDAWKVKPHG